MRLTDIHSKINNAREVDFGAVISESIELFKKLWVQGFLTIIILAVIGVPLALLSQFILEILGLVVPNTFYLDDFSIESFSRSFGVSTLYNFPFTVISTTLQLGVFAGFYRIVKMKDVDNRSTEEYFYYFKKDYLGKLLMLSLVYSAISYVAMLLCFIPYIYVLVPLMFFSVIFAYNPEMSVEEILKTSFMIGNKKWLVTFGSLFVCGLLGMLGLLACFIGVLFTMSIVYFPCYVIYREVVGFDETSEIDQIGKFEEY